MNIYIYIFTHSLCIVHFIPFTQCFAYKEQLTLITCNKTCSTPHHTQYTGAITEHSATALPRGLPLKCHNPRPVRRKICLRWSSSLFGALKCHVRVRHNLLVSVDLHQPWWSIFIQPMRLHCCCRVAVKYCSYPSDFPDQAVCYFYCLGMWMSLGQTPTHTHIQAPYPCVLSASAPSWLGSRSLWMSSSNFLKVLVSLLAIF